MLDLAKILASGLGTGYSKIAPGTMGALLAAIVLGVISQFWIYPSFAWMLGALIVVYAIGWWSVDKVHTIWPHDDNRIVIDEILGILVSLIFIPISAVTILIAFVLFRIFDIWKPLGIRGMESWGGAHGVLMDDVLAGIYTNLVLQAFFYFDILPWR